MKKILFAACAAAVAFALFLFAGCDKSRMRDDAARRNDATRELTTTLGEGVESGLDRAGDRIDEGMDKIGGKIDEGLDKAGEKLSEGLSNADEAASSRAGEKTNP